MNRVKNILLKTWLTSIMMHKQKEDKLFSTLIIYTYFLGKTYRALNENTLCSFEDINKKNSAKWLHYSASTVLHKFKLFLPLYQESKCMIPQL